MNIKKFSKYFKPIALTGILLISAGCIEKSNEESESVQNIRALLKEELNGPDQELEEIWDGFFSDDKDKEEFEKYAKKRSEYIEEHFKPYVSEGAYESFVKANMALGFQWEAYRNDYELKVEDITIEESKTTENSYSFTAEVSYTKEGSSEHKTINLRGLMNTNKEGKIVRIHYHNRLELNYAVGSIAKGHIRFVLYKKFDTHERLNRILKSDTSGIDSYVEKKLMPHYSERVDEMDVKSTSLFFQEIAYENDYELKAEDITIEESKTTENSYDFTVEMTYMKKESNNHKTINLKGLTTTDEKGKIVRIQFHNDKELLDALRK